MDIHRRAFLAQGSLTIGVMLGRPVLAQVQGTPPTAAAAIAKNRAAAAGLLAEVHAKALGLTRASASPFIQREFALRRQLADVVMKLPTDTPNQYVLKEEQPTVVFMSEEKVPLIPPPTEVQPITLRPEKTLSGCQESVVAVLASILLDSLGLSDDILSVVQLMIEKTPELNGAADQIGKSIALKDAEQTTKLILLLIEQMIRSPAVRKSIVTAIGVEAWNRIKGQLALRIGAKFVPFVGQVYLAISVALAVGVNFNRLVTAIQCSSKTV
jgi:hypothetical protein